MTNHLLETKLFIPPQRPDLVLRPHLIDLMERGMSGDLIVISAPAGFGKSTLAASWAQRSQESIAWLSLDEDDNDPARFLSYIVASFQKQFPSFGGDLQNTLQSSQLPQLEPLLTLLIQEISSLDSPVCLVLDDIHVITNLAIFETIDFLVRHLPARITLILIGRIDPAIPLSRLRVAGQLTEIRTNDLRFSESEIEEFLNGLKDLNLSSEDVSAVGLRTEGWIAGLQLVALSLQDRSDRHEFIRNFSGSHHYVIDYLIEEVMFMQPEPVQRFLCRTSVLDQFCASLCDATLEIMDSRKILKHLDDSNLFLIPLDDERNWYRYHHLFSDFLEQCLLEDDAELVPDLHMRAAKWYQEAGQVSEAVNHALAAKNYSWAGQLVERNAEALLEQSELAGLMRLVEKLPEVQILKQPWLCIYHTWALRLSGSPYDLVEARLEAVEEVLESRRLADSNDPRSNNHLEVLDEEAKLRCHLKAIRAFQALFREDLPEVIRLAQQVQACAQDDPACQPKDYFLRSSTAFALGWAYRFSGDLNAATEAFGEATSNALKTGNIYMAAASQCRAAYGQVMAGNLNLAVRNLENAAALATLKDGSKLPVVGYAYVYLGGIYLERNDLEKAGQFLGDGIEYCERVGYVMDQAVGYVYLARLRIAQGDYGGALQAIQEAEQLNQKMKGYLYLQRWVEDSQVRLWIATGEMKALEKWARNCGLGIQDEYNFKRDIEHIILARALVALARAYPEQPYGEEALLLLARILEMAEAAGWMGKAIEILVLQAMAFGTRGDDLLALKAIEKALILAEPEGYLRIFADEGQEMEHLLNGFPRRRESSQYVKKLLVDFKSGERLAFNNSPEPLTKREREILEMLTTELSGPEIADRMNISLTTFRFHTRNIYSKLNVHNRRSAVRLAEEIKSN